MHFTNFLLNTQDRQKVFFVGGHFISKILLHEIQKDRVPQGYPGLPVIIRFFLLYYQDINYFSTFYRNKNLAN